MEQRKIIHMLDATVDDLLDGFVEVDNFTVSEILHDNGYLDELPNEIVFRLDTAREVTV